MEKKLYLHEKLLLLKVNDPRFKDLETDGIYNDLTSLKKVLPENEIRSHKKRDVNNSGDNPTL